jgi:hypothetical protein
MIPIRKRFLPVWIALRERDERDGKSLKIKEVKDENNHKESNMRTIIKESNMRTSGMTSHTFPDAFGVVTVVTALVLAVLFGPTQAFAAPQLGGQLFSLGGNVEVKVLPASAGYTSELHLFSPGSDRFIATNRDVGLTVDLGAFPAGVELLFGIFVRDTGKTFQMGPASRNPDGIEHAVVNFLAPGLANVGFEDLLGGGDRDFDDNVFQFRGAIGPSTSTVPEPSSWLLLGSSLVGLVTWCRHKRSANSTGKVVCLP